MTDSRVILLAVLYSLALVPLVSLDPSPYSQRLCANDEGQVRTDTLRLFSVSDLESISTDGCDDYTREAFNKFRKLVDCNNVCSMEHATEVTKYISSYLATRQLTTKLPHKFARFALAYGMRVSEHCKVRLLEGPLSGIKLANNGASPFIKLTGWTENNYHLVELMELAPKWREQKVRLPSDYSALLAELPADNNSKLINRPVLRLKNSQNVKRAQEVCDQFIRPVYEPGMLPIAHLARNGINYHKSGLIYEYTQTKGELFRENLLMPSRIIFVCECLKQFEVIELMEPKYFGNKLEIYFSPDTTSVSHDASRHDDDSDKPQLASEELAAAATGSDNDHHHHQTIKFDHVAGPYEFKKKLHHGYRFGKNDKILHHTFYDYIDEMEAALDDYNPKGKELTEFRHQLFRKSVKFLIEENLLAILKLLIRVASLQVTIDGNDSEQNVGELKVARDNLIKLVASELWSRFDCEISTMIKGGRPVLRELARRIETLIISLDVALSCRYPDE